MPKNHSVKALLFALMLVLGVTPFAVAADAQMSPVVRGRHVVHLIAIKPGDPKLASAFDSGLRSLKDKQEVVVLFDGQSVTWLRTTGKDKGTLLHKARLADGERRAIGERLGAAPSAVPRNYFEYVQLFAKRGVKVYANRNSIEQYGLSPDEIHPLATLVSTEQISGLVDEADSCSIVGAAERR